MSTGGGRETLVWSGFRRGWWNSGGRGEGRTATAGGWAAGGSGGAGNASRHASGGSRRVAACGGDEGRAAGGAAWPHHPPRPLSVTSRTSYGPAHRQRALSLAPGAPRSIPQEPPSVGDRGIRGLPGIVEVRPARGMGRGTNRLTRWWSRGPIAGRRAARLTCEADAESCFPSLHRHDRGALPVAAGSPAPGGHPPRISPPAPVQSRGADPPSPRPRAEAPPDSPAPSRASPSRLPPPASNRAQRAGCSSAATNDVVFPQAGAAPLPPTSSAPRMRRPRA